jgi:hypothetical protein
MDIRSLLVAYAQSAKLVEPSKASLDDPAPSAQPAAVLSVTLCQERLNTLGAQTLPNYLRVITTVS